MNKEQINTLIKRAKERDATTLPGTLAPIIEELEKAVILRTLAWHTVAVELGCADATLTLAKRRAHVILAEWRENGVEIPDLKKDLD